MKVLVTGSKGFIGKNLTQYLKHLPDIDLLEHQRKDSIKKLKNKQNLIALSINVKGSGKKWEVLIRQYDTHHRKRRKYCSRYSKRNIR